MCTHHSLDSESFLDAVRRYIDQEKPDPLQKRQMENWKWVWHDANDNSNEGPPATGLRPRLLDFEPTNVTMGCLEWMGDIIVIFIRAQCYWMGNERDGGSLFFRCWAGARFADLSDVRTEANIQKKMRERLRQDDYIATKLFGSDRHRDDDDNHEDIGQGQGLHELCQVSIKTNNNDSNGHCQLEERVFCNEETAEAIRRAIYSTAPNGPIDVFDIVCDLPFLPVHLTGLAKRAKLRLLEDAMYDACENEGEEVLVQGLELDQQRHRGDSDENTKADSKPSVASQGATKRARSEERRGGRDAF